MSENTNCLEEWKCPACGYSKDFKIRITEANSSVSCCGCKYEADAAMFMTSGIALTGSWPKNDIRRAFVAGAKWWEFKKTGFTMWPSDRDVAEVEAEKRYGK